MSDFIEVRIHGQLFKLRAGEEKEYVRELAAYVDNVMQTLARQSNTISTERLAIMAALNVTDTLFQQTRRAEGAVKTADERITRLITLSDQLLGG
ncbi:MAG: cell division protein ZapA [Magnetococcus sp. XQGC-1]